MVDNMHLLELPPFSNLRSKKTTKTVCACSHRRRERERKRKRKKTGKLKTTTSQAALSPAPPSPHYINLLPPSSPDSYISIYFEAARPTAPFSRSYTLYHLLRNASPRIANGPTGSGISIPIKVETQLPPISRM